MGRNVTDTPDIAEEVQRLRDEVQRSREGPKHISIDELQTAITTLTYLNFWLGHSGEMDLCASVFMDAVRIHESTIVDMLQIDFNEDYDLRDAWETLLGVTQQIHEAVRELFIAEIVSQKTAIETMLAERNIDFEPRPPEKEEQEEQLDLPAASAATSDSVPF